MLQKDPSPYSFRTLDFYVEVNVEWESNRQLDTFKDTLNGRLRGRDSQHEQESPDTRTQPLLRRHRANHRGWWVVLLNKLFRFYSVEHVCNFFDYIQSFFFSISNIFVFFIFYFFLNCRYMNVSIIRRCHELENCRCTLRAS